MSGAHLGYKKVYSRLSIRYYWKNMLKDIMGVVQACVSCQRIRVPHHTQIPGNLMTWLTEQPGDLAVIDFQGPFETTARGNKHTCTISDYHTKIKFTRAIPTDDAQHTVGVLAEYISIYGAPKCILSDRGKTFESTLVRGLYLAFGIRGIRTSAYHPQTNGMVERYHRDQPGMLFQYCHEHPADWDIYIVYLTYAYNGMLHPTIGMSPFVAMFGRDAPPPYETVFALAEGTTQPPQEEELRARLTTIWAMAREATALAHQQEEYVYNQGHPGVEYEVGDLVMVHVTARKSRARIAKMSFHYIGPYRITTKVNRLLYKVAPAAQPEAARRQQREFGDEQINIARLKSFHDVPPHIQQAARDLEEIDVPAEDILEYAAAQRAQQFGNPPAIETAPVPQLPQTHEEFEEEELRRLDQLRLDQQQLLSQQEEMLRDV